MNSHRRLATLLLALPGALLAHSFAYLWAYPASFTLAVGRSHGYLPVAGPLVGLAGVLVLAWLAVLGVRAADADTMPSVLGLAAAQVTVFCLQECLEVLAAGAGPADLLGEPAVLLGLALQLPIAGLLVGLVRAGQVLAGLLLTACQPQVAMSPVPQFPAQAMVTVRPVMLSVGRRGPPVFV